MKITMSLVLTLLMGMSAAAPGAGKDTDFSADRQKVDAIFAAHDRMKTGLDDYFKSVADDIILMPNGGPLVEGKSAYRKHIEDLLASGDMKIRHESVAVYSYPEIVVVRGRATGSFVGNGQTTTNLFETRNIFVLRRLGSGDLQVWQIIFNNIPVAAAKP